MTTSLRPNWEQERNEFGLGGKIEGINAKNIQTPKERFDTKLYEAFEDLQSLDPSLPLTNAMRAKIIQFTLTLNHVVFKNTVALVLGCILAARSKDTLDKTAFNNMLPLLDIYAGADNITAEDLVRYSRYAIQHGFEPDFSEDREESNEVSNVWEWI